MENLNIPNQLTTTDLKQIIQIDKQVQIERLVIQNFFSAGIESSIPSNTIAKTFSSKADSTSMIKVNINDQIVYATPPSSFNGTEPPLLKDNDDSLSVAMKEDFLKKNLLFRE
jgi:hypothetical protein